MGKNQQEYGTDRVNVFGNVYDTGERNEKSK